jgi:hypothetical protein
MTKRCVFISHASLDDGVADKVMRWLRNAGLKGRLDQTDILPARNWRNEIHQGVQSASAVVVLISAASLRSKYVRQEWELAMSHGVPVVPALIGRERRLPPRLRHLQYVDLRRDESTGWKKLLVTLRPANLRQTGPIIRIKFEFDPSDEPNMTEDGGAYDILMTTDNVPPGTTLVKYELLDPSYDKPIRQSSSREDNFEAWTTASGDVPVIARGLGRRGRGPILWTARATFAAALAREYTRVKRQAVRRALDKISSN